MHRKRKRNTGGKRKGRFLESQTKGDPAFKTKEWLKNIPKDILDAKGMVKEAGNSKLVPMVVRGDYEEMFTTHEMKLAQLRAAFEISNTEQKYNLDLFKSAAMQVCRFRADMKAWEGLKKLYTK